MSALEKRAWIRLGTAIAAYATYLGFILIREDGIPLPEVPYVPALLWTIGGAIVVSIVLDILVSILSPRDAGQADQRDREIARFGDTVGQSFVVIGGVAALLMALLQLPYFWIANAVYLAFVLSAVLGGIARLVAYRRGLPQW
ncbi:MULTISPECIES: hypothetical protein [Cryobacterium]|uniref:Uncharacterized protein n=1 Tax=Cryobacterium glucosi TaxID=1259175 RepID=A0ABY2IR99_9MICO|nr:MULTISPECIES: hypothetical protein [Cryobacterium]MDY7527134.1 hypothetical protein [Cryobacterium sp. 10C2]MDY7557076.1 hypothetical protein [Cryobacterium sp. 10C3]MEB0003102.1 hypothetical protein [Cryobacterium sp. RTC2.1]MEB0200370.1 hypothetical protein [Cryobacterium sp. 5I3]MEB0286262.1 hypothetical protein [Cryobacterium sp. 10S3]